MKRFLSSAGLMLLAFSVRAHDSSVPHTHHYASDHSDLFHLSLAALVAGVAGYGAIRVWCRNRQANGASPEKRRR